MVISSIPGSGGGVQNQSLQSTDASGQAPLTVHVSRPGTGGMQGTDVSVGDGSARTAVLEDSSQATSMFSRMWNAAGKMAGGIATAWTEVNNALAEAQGLNDFDDDYLEEDESSSVGEADDVVVDHEPDNDVSDVGDPISNKLQIDDSRGLDAVDDINEDHEVGEIADRVTEQLHAPRSAIGDLTVQSSDEPWSLEDLLGEGVKDLPPLVVGNQAERDASEAEVQQPQQGWMSGLRNMAGWVAGGVVNMLPTAIVGLAPGQASVVQPSGQASDVQAPSQTFSDKNLADASKLVKKIDTAMKTLNLQLRALGVESASGPIAPREQMDQPQLTTGDTLKRWYYQARGGASAAITTLGWATLGAGTAAVGANLPGLSPEMLTIRATALLGGAYVGLSALRDFPELATNQAAIDMLNGEMPAILKDMVDLDDIMGQERARQTGMVRAMLVTEARNPRIEALQVELASVTKALESAEAGEVEAVPELRHEVALGDGKASTEVKNLATQAREAFSSAFASIGRGLASIGRFIADLPNVPGRWMDARAADKAEQAYAKEAQMMFDVLGKPGNNSQIGRGVDVRASERANANGIKHDISHVRVQCQRGENLTRALLGQQEQAFGAVAYKNDRDEVSVKASLTTARAMAWYLDAIAAPENINDPTAPKVTRNEDGSLTIKDPDRKLYSFLMNVPVAYTGALDGDENQQSLAFHIDDHGQGMPQGMHGMRFETRVDDNGQEELHLAFTPKSANPVFKPVGNETQRFKNMYEAAYSSQKPEVAAKTDFSTWPAPLLAAHQTKVLAQLNRENAMRAADQQQVSALQNWHNPDFISGRV